MNGVGRRTACALVLETKESQGSRRVVGGGQEPVNCPASKERPVDPEKVTCVL